MKKIKLMNMEIHDRGRTETHAILRVFGGWIYTDMRNNNAPSGVFVPYPETVRPSEFEIEIELYN